MRKMIAVILAVSVVAISASIIMAITPTVELLAWYENDYEQTKEYYDAATTEKLIGGLDQAELHAPKMTEEPGFILSESEETPPDKQLQYEEFYTIEKGIVELIV